MSQDVKPTVYETIVRLRADNKALLDENEQLKTEVKLRDAVLSMTVARLGGTVEGNPTGRHNFLQRIDELVSKEAENAQNT